MGLRSLLLALLLLASCLGQAATPQPPSASLTELADLPVEQLALIPIENVSAASRHEQRVTQAPSSISIVTSDEVKKLGFRTLAEVLQSVGGLYLTYDRNYSYLGVRGFGRPGDYNSRVLLLVDGHRMNDNIYDSALLGTEGMVDVDLIDRVEVIRGPSSSIYGESAFFGVINVVTKRGAQLNGVEASVEVGAFDTYKGRFSYGHKFTNDIELIVSGSWYESDGQERLFYPEFNNPTNNHGVAVDSDHDSSQSLFGSISWKEFTLSTGFSNREKQIPTASFMTVFNSRLEKTTDLRAYADLKFEHAFSPDLGMMARVYYDAYWYDGEYPYYATNYVPTFNPAAIVINGDDALGEWVGTEWQLTKTLFERHVLIAGFEYRENVRQLQHTFYEQPGLPDVRIERTGRNVGFYGQAEVEFRTNLVLNAGLRYDYYSTFGGTVNPRVGVIYSPWEQTTFKFLFGEAFRAPNVFELYYEDPGFNRANPELKPETIRTYELVWEQYLPASTRVRVSGYYYQIRDLISQESDALNQTFYANVDRVDAKGIEVELEHRSSAGLLARVGYACQRAEDGQTGKELSNSPRHLAKFNLIAPVYKDRLFTGVEVLYRSRVGTERGPSADEFAVVNLTLFSQNIVKGLELSATIYNLFDTRYGFPVSHDLQQNIVNQDGRGFRVKLTYKF